MNYLIASLTGFIIGIASGLYVSSADPVLVQTLRGSTLGSHNTDFTIYGFQPFWLLDIAHEDYGSYLTSFGYFGLQLAEDGHVRKLNSDVEEEPGWTNLKSNRVRDILNKAPETQMETSLVVQSVNEDNIDILLSDPVLHATNMLEDVLPIMEEYEFTDLNIDIESFEYAGPERQQQFTLFVQTVSEGIKEAQAGTVSIDVTPISLVESRMIDVDAIEPYVDTIILMTYDYHYTGSYIAGPVAPLGGAGEIREFDVRIAVDEALKRVPSNKILLGIPTYGYEWDTLTDIPNAPVIANTGKTASLRRVTELLKDCKNCKQGRDELTRQPYLIIPVEEEGYYRQIFYEDTQSILEKITYAKEKKLKGIAIWAIGYETDDAVRLLQSIR